MENFGTGIPRILNAYAGQEKQPFFDPTENFFKLTLPNLIFNIDPILDLLTDFEIALMKTTKENPGLNALQLLNKMLLIYPNETSDKKMKLMEQQEMTNIDIKENNLYRLDGRLLDTCFDVLHTAGRAYIIEDIDIFIDARKNA